MIVDIHKPPVVYRPHPSQIKSEHQLVRLLRINLELLFLENPGLILVKRLPQQPFPKLANHRVLLLFPILSEGNMVSPPSERNLVSAPDVLPGHLELLLLLTRPDFRLLDLFLPRVCKCLVLKVPAFTLHLLDHLLLGVLGLLGLVQTPELEEVLQCLVVLPDYQACHTGFQTVIEVMSVLSPS